MQAAIWQGIHCETDQGRSEAVEGKCTVLKSLPIENRWFKLLVKTFGSIDFHTAVFDRAAFARAPLFVNISAVCLVRA